MGSRRNYDGRDHRGGGGGGRGQGQGRGRGGNDMNQQGQGPDGGRWRGDNRPGFRCTNQTPIQPHETIRPPAQGGSGTAQGFRQQPAPVQSGGYGPQNYPQQQQGAGPSSGRGGAWTGRPFQPQRGQSSTGKSFCYVIVGICLVMFIGADVNHLAPSNVSSPSIAAVVGSINWPAAISYAARICQQKHRKEEIENFGTMLLDLIKTYAERNGVCPNKTFLLDQMNELAYHLCLTYAAFTEPISVVPPICYADKVVFRGRLYQQVSVEWDRSFEQSSYNMNPNLKKNTMFFI